MIFILSAEHFKFLKWNNTARSKVTATVFLQGNIQVYFHCTCCNCVGCVCYPLDPWLPPIHLSASVASLLQQLDLKHNNNIITTTISISTITLSIKIKVTDTVYLYDKSSYSVFCGLRPLRSTLKSIMIGSMVPSRFLPRPSPVFQPIFLIRNSPTPPDTGAALRNWS